uniref:Uncharacterized protein n=1 Tax=Coccolithus braarudii TaxID=221442 RepID=A0A7S0LQI7_9EUKA
MVQKRPSPFGQGGKESKVVAQFAASFVPTSEETEAEKKGAREWDRSALLSVKDDDPQAQIYEQFAQNANTNAEGVNTRKGLGCGTGSGGSSAVGGLRRGVSFVSSGGGGATAAAAPYTSSRISSTSGMQSAASSVPPGWTEGRDPSSGLPYYVNLSTGVTQWERPTGGSTAVPMPPSLPPGWHAVQDPASGRAYYANPATGQTQWTPPQPPLPSEEPPPPPPPLPPPPVQQPAAAVAGAMVRVSGVPSEFSEGDVRELLSAHGRIVSVHLERGAYSAQRAPKVARITFDAEGSADLAVRKMNGTTLRGSTLELARM